MSVGSLAAIGGAYVPVNDAAVTLNTGYLVYKECVLKAINNRMREDSIARLVNQSARTFMTGRGGNPMYPEVLSRDILQRSDDILNGIFSSGRLNTVSPAFQGDVTRAIARNYAAQTRNSSASLACSYAGSALDLAAVLRGERFTGYGDLLALADPNCNPLFSYYNSQNYVANEIGAGIGEMMTRLSWSNGVYDVQETLPDGTLRTVTPGFLVAGTIQQQLGAGFDMQKSADDIDEMVGALFAGIGNALLYEASNGLRGLVARGGNQPSYLDQVVEQSGATLRESAINAALQILLAARTVQATFLENERASADVLARAVEDLRGAENRCWELIVTKVKESAETDLRIATTTVASQRVIDASIAPLASSTASRITLAQRGFDSVDALITGAINSDPQAQGTALKTLDDLVAQKALQNQYDLKASEQRREDVRSAMSDLVRDAIKMWGDDPDPNKGWCNINNPDVIEKWSATWKK